MQFLQGLFVYIKRGDFMVIHTVQSGETIYSVARNYDVSPTLLALSNGITGSLVVGEDLVVLFPEQVHTVRVGETLSEIAALYGTSVRKLYQNNYYLKGKNTLYPGQTLVISYTDMPSRDILTNGYAYPYVNANVLKTSLPYVDYLSPFTYGMTFSGNLIPPKDEEMLDAAYRLGTYGALHLSTLDANDRFDTALATNIFNNYVARETLLKEIAETMRQKNFSLIDVDFEYINGADAENYAAFVQDLKQLGYPVIAAAAPKTSREQKGQLYEGHDYALLGDAADYLFVMTYEWGYTYGPPMAVAPLPNVRRVLEFAVTETQPDKILMGIPNYGYDFSLPYVAGASRATSIGNRRAVDIARQHKAEIQFDQTAMSPYFTYRDMSGTVHEVWFENARSIYAKFGLLKELGLKGAGYWNLMREFPQLWLLQNALFF